MRSYEISNPAKLDFIPGNEKTEAAIIRIRIRIINIFNEPSEQDIREGIAKIKFANSNEIHYLQNILMFRQFFANL